MSAFAPLQVLRSPCLCASAQAARTLDALAQTGPLTYLDMDLEALALLGTQLADALILTNNGSALLSEKGGYAAYQTSSMPHRVSSCRINMRICPTAPVNLVRTQGIGGRLALFVVDGSGQISHRIETDGGYDGAVLATVDEGRLKGGAPANNAVLANGIVSLNAVRSARLYWDCRDTGHHLNDILHDGGRIRRSTLPHVGKYKAWPVLTAVLPSFITYLRENEIGHVQLVPGAGFIQSSMAWAGKVELLDQILLVRNEQRSFAIDLSNIESMWATRIGPVSQLEIYSHAGDAIAILAADPNGNYGQWNTLLGSLPPAAYAVEK
jgi:putative heme degradation protein